MGIVETNNEKNSATNIMTDYIRDLLTLKIRLPLGNSNLKLLHTNQFLYTELPSEYFELANFDEISKVLQSSESRYSGYQVNRWYIEEIHIVNDSGKFEMELTLNPFASTLNRFRDDRKSFEDAYTNAINQNQNKKTKKKKKKKTSKKNNLPGGEGKFIDNLVKKIVGKETDDLKKSKLIHKHLLKHLSCVYYLNSKFSSAEKAYKHRKLNCADTSRVNASMHRSAGVDCYVVHISGNPGHYYTVVKIKNKLYCTDPVGGRRKYNYFWSSKNSNNKFKGKKSYEKKCGKNPCS